VSPSHPLAKLNPMVPLFSSDRRQIPDSVDIAAILDGRTAFFHLSPCNEMRELARIPDCNADISLS
jgi:hypothetical protein